MERRRLLLTSLAAVLVAPLNGHAEPPVVINLKTARPSVFTLPRSLLARADQVIE